MHVHFHHHIPISQLFSTASAKKKPTICVLGEKNPKNHFGPATTAPVTTSSIVIPNFFFLRSSLPLLATWVLICLLANPTRTLPS
jgi:hypothetical protein